MVSKQKSKGVRGSRDRGFPHVNRGFQRVWHFQNPKASGSKGWRFSELKYLMIELLWPFVFALCSIVKRGNEIPWHTQTHVLLGSIFLFYFICYYGSVSYFLSWSNWTEEPKTDSRPINEDIFILSQAVRKGSIGFGPRFFAYELPRVMSWKMVQNQIALICIQNTSKNFWSKTWDTLVPVYDVHEWIICSLFFVRT